MEAYAGQSCELDDITIKEITETSVTADRYITAEISGPAKFYYSNEDEVAVDNNLICTDVDNDRIVWKISGEPDSKYILKKLLIIAPMDANGDITLKFGGNAGVTGEILAAKMATVLSAEAENPTRVIAGKQGQAASDLIIKETAPGAFMEDRLVLAAPDGVSFDSRPTVEVFGEELKLTEDNLVYLEDADNDGLFELAGVTVEEYTEMESGEIKFGNIRLNVDRSCPEGPVAIRVTGGAVVEAGSTDLFGTDFLSAKIASVVTPASPGETEGGLFMLGRIFYNLREEIKMMDIAPYLKDGRIFVPLRYLAYACGLSDGDIVWDEASKTVSLRKDDKNVKLVVGSNILMVDDDQTVMDVAPEMHNGRTMLPARHVVEAFGGTVTWNEDGQTVGVDF
jgi:Copper amine oxidase N-terminal domain.